MYGNTEQFIVLVNFGNAYLSGLPLENDFYPNHGAFAYGNDIKFKDSEARGGEVYASDPILWFERLKAEGYRRLQLRYVYVDLNFEQPGIQPSAEERKLAEYAGVGVIWVIEAIKGSQSDFWISKGNFKYEDDPKKEGEYELYERIPADIALPMYESPSLKSLKEKLAQSLASMRDFANENDLKSFGEIFGGALSCLEADETSDTELVYPHTLSAEATNLLLACRAASGAFGGMGSWNDSVSNEETHELYALIQRATEAAVNSSL